MDGTYKSLLLISNKPLRIQTPQMPYVHNMNKLARTGNFSPAMDLWQVGIFGS